MSIEIISRVWKHSKAKGSDRLCLLALADDANDMGYAWPGVTRLGNKTGMSRRHIYRLIENLAQIREVYISRNEGSVNQYIVRCGQDKKDFLTAAIKYLHYDYEAAEAAYLTNGTSDILSPTSDILSPATSDILSPTSDILSPGTSDILSPTSDIDVTRSIYKNKYIWREITDILKNTMPKASYETLIGPTDLVAINGTGLELMTKSGSAFSWLSTPAVKDNILRAANLVLEADYEELTILEGNP